MQRSIGRLLAPVAVAFAVTTAATAAEAVDRHCAHPARGMLFAAVLPLPLTVHAVRQTCQIRRVAAVCCKTPDGSFVNTTTERCKGVGGSVVPDRYCHSRSPSPKGRVCCADNHGPTIVPAEECPPPNASLSQRHPLPMEKCTEMVCCRVGAKLGAPAVYEMKRAMDCPYKGNQFKVPIIRCKARPQSVCCRLAYPGAPYKYVLIEPRKCTSPHGTVVGGSFCRQIKRRRLRPRSG